MLVYQSEYQLIYFEQLSSVLRWVRLSSDKLNDKIYRQETLEFLKIVEKYRPKKLFINSQELRFKLSLDLQDWINQEIYPKVFALGTKKGAILLPKDMKAQISVEQVLEEFHTNQFHINYFDEEKAALAWLVND
jgi:hypothetical protein